MTDLLAARSQMAMSLGFHIIFAAVGVALPLLMVIAEALHLPLSLMLVGVVLRGTSFTSRHYDR